MLFLLELIWYFVLYKKHVDVILKTYHCVMKSGPIENTGVVRLLKSVTLKPDGSVVTSIPVQLDGFGEFFISNYKTLFFHHLFFCNV